MHRLRIIVSVLFCWSAVLLAQEKPTLAVLEFDGFGVSGQEVAALTNRLRTNLTQLGAYRIIERLWRSLKKEWIRFYTHERTHQSLGRQTPEQVYFNQSTKELAA